MSAGYTPKPWKWVDRVLKGPAKYAGPSDMGGFIGADGKVVCWFGDAEDYYPTEGEPPSDADKALIASAPELLEALIGVVSVADRDTPEFRAARTAIAKARGEA